MLKRIDRTLLRVPSVAAAVRYYTATLGMTLIKQDARLASLRLGDSDAELILHADPDLPAEATYYLVDDVRDLHRRRAELKLTFVSPPSRAARGWRGTVKDPFGNVLLLLDRTAEGTPAAAGGSPAASHPSAVVEDAKPAGSLFAGVEPPAKVDRAALTAVYGKVGLTADDLPYTPQFETLFRDYIAALPDPKPTRAETWRQLLNLRKAGKLPKHGEARSRPPEVSDEARAHLQDMIGDALGRRDRLPYTKLFDDIVDAFNKTQPRPLSPHLVWRLVATLAK